MEMQYFVISPVHAPHGVSRSYVASLIAGGNPVVLPAVYRGQHTLRVFNGTRLVYVTVFCAPAGSGVSK